jgi:hypothetical protein
MSENRTPLVVPDGPPDQAWAMAVCKIGQGSECCRYLTIGREGWSCERYSDLGRQINANQSKMTAKGINCEGRESVG